MDAHDAVMERLCTLFDDSEKSVRDAAASVFRSGVLFERDSTVALAKKFVESRALDDNVDDLLHGLEQLAWPFRPYAMVLSAVVDRFTGPLAAEARDYRTRRPIDAGVLAKVLLRLYEQSERDRPLRRRCLDAWDGLLHEGIGYDVLVHIDG